jgi:hypothetical protein
MGFIKSCDKCAKQIEDWYHMVCGCSCHEDLKKPKNENVYQ